MRNYRVFIFKSAGKATGYGLETLVPDTPAGTASLRQRIEAVKERMRDLGMREEAKQDRPGGWPRQSATT